jgi:hypothetical protein
MDVSTPRQQVPKAFGTCWRGVLTAKTVPGGR